MLLLLLLFYFHSIVIKEYLFQCLLFAQYLPKSSVNNIIVIKLRKNTKESHCLS